MSCRAIFFGTPDFAVPCLQALCEVAEVTLVVTQPDRKAGRGMKLTAPAVKLAAQELGIEVAQPRKVRTEAFAQRMRDQRADVGLVVAYGRILPLAVLDAPRLGMLNVHGSLLPKYRGAAPIQWAIARGETETGVCLMRMDEGMDTGPELARRVVPIAPDDNAGELWQRLSRLGATIVRQELPRYMAGELEAVEQDHAAATMAPVLSRADGEVRWDASAREVHDLIRGMTPWPGAYTFLSGRRVKLHRASVLSDTADAGEAGKVIRADGHGIEVACGGGVLSLLELQLAGKKRMDAAQVCAGRLLGDDPHFSGEDE